MIIAQPPVVATIAAPVVAPVAPVAPVVAPAVTVAPVTTVAPAVAPVGAATANRAPIASPGNVLAGAARTTPFALQAADPEGSPVSFALAQLPAHGKLTGQAPNLAYTPDSGFVGLDAFSFTASDGKDSSPQATVMVTVTGSTKATKTKVSKKVRLVCRGRGTRRVCR